MSMVAQVRRVSASELDELIRDPSDIFWYLHGKERPRPPPGLLSRLLRRRSPPSLPRETWTPPEADRVLDLGQSWHCLHYLLCGEAWRGEPPAGCLLNGGQQLGSVDVGYGPARAVRPAEVIDFACFLSDVSEAVLRPRCDPVRMREAQIYGAVEDPEEFDLLWSYVEDLREFVASAAGNGEGLVIFVS